MERKSVSISSFITSIFGLLVWTVALPAKRSASISFNSWGQKSKRKVQGVPRSQTAALPKHQEEKETDKSKQVQIDKTYEKH